MSSFNEIRDVAAEIVIGGTHSLIQNDKRLSKPSLFLFGLALFFAWTVTFIYELNVFNVQQLFEQGLSRATLFFRAANGQYLTPDPNSNPIIYYIKWVVSESVGGLNAGIQNEEYTNGVNCP